MDSGGRATVLGWGGLGLTTTPGVVAPQFPNAYVNVANPSAGVVLRLNARERRQLTALPRQGSFALASVVAPRTGSEKLTVIVPPPAGSIRIKSSLPSPIMISYNNRELPSAVFQYLRADAGEAGVMRLVHLPAGDYTIGTRGARWVNVRLEGGEQAAELVPIPPPTRRPPKF